MTTPQPRSSSNTFIDGHDELDDRLTEAFARYDEAFQSRLRAPQSQLVQARMDLSLLLWQDDETAPAPVQEQLAADGDALLRDTPPL